MQLGLSATPVFFTATLAALILVSDVETASAQTAPSVTATTTARELVRKGREVFNREDYPAALALFRSAAEQGDAEAQDWVGTIYLHGWGVQKNYAEGLIWLRKSAAQGFASAQCRLGSMYKHGWGVPQNDAEAVLWFRKAAEGGDVDAQNVVGFMYALGEGVPKDYARAVRWFRKAAETLHFRCLIEVAADKRNNPKAYDECLRTEWKRLMGSELFPRN
jgi:TPR repeat protein